jgi:hypothetical protein
MKVVGMCSILLLLALAAGCHEGSTGRSHLTMSSGGRSVKADLDGSGGITGHDGVIEINFSAGKLAIEKAALRLNGEELAKIPETSRNVEVDSTAGKLTVTVDGNVVVSKEIKK